MSQSPLVTTFNPHNATHVLWLKKLFGVLDIMKLNADDIIKQERAIVQYDMEGTLKSNPMNVTIDQKALMEFPIVHFALAMKYSDAVLKCQAWVPDKQ